MNNNPPTDAHLELPLLGGYIEITLYSVKQYEAINLLPTIEREALRLQKIFNFYDEKSELSTLNRERHHHASNELIEVLTTALMYCDLTNGRYDITLGKQILQRKQGQKLTPVTCSYRDITINDRTITLNHHDVMIDLGSIAKGYIADKLSTYLTSLGIKDHFIDARGDLLATGNHHEVVAIQDPRRPNHLRQKFVITHQAVATSGDYKQYHHTFDKSHIINATDIISATIVAPNLMLADVLASVFFVSGSKDAPLLANHFPNASIYLITNHNTALSLNNFDHLLLEHQLKVLNPLPSVRA